MRGTKTDTGSSQQNQGNGMPAAPEETMAPDQMPPLVLIAEDEEPIAETISFLVEDNGYVPLVANNGRRALELARQHHPALVVTDLMMPFLDGDELISVLHADAAADNRARPATILLSAAGARRMWDAEADAILPKPFELDDLERLMRHFLGQPPASG